ncbi:unnamed protein product, partial [marine sediment metagenome]
MVDFYSQVPKDLIPNLEYRLAIRKAAQHDRDLQRACMTACREDVLYWLNTFFWLYEPRPRIVDGITLPHKIPFITWLPQDRAILKILKHLGFDDIVVEKSRGEGASWIGVAIVLHYWIFRDMSAMGLVSRNEAAVDNPEDPDSLFWKIDWEL